MLTLRFTAGSWQSLESSYEVEDLEEAHPEPPNVQEISLSRDGKL